MNELGKPFPKKSAQKNFKKNLTLKNWANHLEKNPKN